MKKILSFAAVIIAVVLSFKVGSVYAHHNTITQNASCQGYTVSADYVGGSAYRRVLTDVDFKLDNNSTEHINQDWRGISNGFNIFTRTGTGNHEVKVTGTVKLYSCEQDADDIWTQNGIVKCDAGGSNNSDDGWDLIETDTFTLDYKGQCITPTPTSTPTPTPSPTPTVTPTPTPTETPTPTPTEEVTPTPTPSPTPEPECESECEPEVTPTPSPTPEPCRENCGTPPTFQGSTTNAPQCPDVAPTKIGANFHIYRKGGDAIAKWFATEGSKVHIYYVNINDLSDVHALRDVTNDGYEDNLHLLGNKDWRFGLQQVNGCAAGPIVWVDDGATDGWVLFR